MIHLSFSSGIFPETMRIAKIIRVFKNDDKLVCNNYRRISLLPNLSRMFEKLMHHSLTLFLENNKKLFKFQFGFRNNHSCFNHALINLTEQRRNTLDDNKFACGVLIDLRKAFNTTKTIKY